MKKTITKIAAFLLSATIIMTGFTNLAVANQLVLAAETEIPEGYTPIYTPGEFDNIRNDLDGNYILMNDITFQAEDFQEGGTYYNDGIGWIPIGSDEEPFTGVLDGNGFTVSGISTTWNDEDYEFIGLYVGLFGYSQGTIKNLTVSNDLCAGSTYKNTYSVTNMPWLGNLVGYNGGEIINCHNKDFTSFDTITRGGLAGRNNGEIVQCTNQSNVQAHHQAGGIAIRNYGTIQESANNGLVRVAGRSLVEKVPLGYAGGIAAENFGTIANSFNLGQIVQMRSNAVGTKYAGIAMSSNTATVKNCYNLGLVENTGDYDGLNKLISNRCTNCYAWDIQGTGETAVSRTADEMKEQSTYQGFDFENVWQMSDNPAYPFPVLKNVPLEIDHRQVMGSYISKPPSRTVFEVGEKIDLAGGEIAVIFSDGTVENNPTGWCYVYQYDLDYNTAPISSFSQHGNYKVMLIEVSSGFMAEIELQCVAEKKLTGITVSPPSKTQYLEGEELNLIDMTVTATYNTQQQEAITDYTLTGFDNTKAGKQIVTVSYGGYSDTFEVTVNHDWETEFTIDQDPTCSVPGSKSRHCTRCDAKTDITEIPATGSHIDADAVWGSDETNHWQVCDSCGIIFNTDTHTGGEATCSTKAVCTVCGTEYGELDPGNHVNTEIRDAVAATEESEGYSGDKWCLDCNQMIEEGKVVAKLDHTHAMVKTEAKPATHEEDGNIEYYTCSKCGKMYSDEAGTRELTDAEIVIKATGHSYGTEWESDTDSHWHECTCGERSDEGTHTFGEWTVTKEATAAEDGSRERECSVCGYVQSEIINATGGIADDDTNTNETDNPDDSKVPQTGDDSNIVLWLALMVAGSCGIIATAAAKRKCKANK